MSIEPWGRFPKIPQKGLHPSWPEEVRKYGLEYQDKGYLPFGNGRSYGDVCLAESQNVIVSRGLDRFMAFDREDGTIRVQAGITLGDILEIVVQAGWFLPVIPGTRFATVGGAIANDVHGKNHHVKGTFGRYIRRLWLVRDGKQLECSPTNNSDLFRATIGGLGLTGFITEAEISLMPVSNGDIDVTTHRFNCLRDFFTLADEYDRTHEYGVAWIDCLSHGDETGRGVYFAGNHARYRSTNSFNGSSVTFPFTPPISLVNRVSLRAFNQLYWHTKPTQPKQERVPYLNYFFPLDGIQNWNRMYGVKGFQQYQCVIPLSDAHDVMSEILKTISDAKSGSFLAVLKRCGDMQSPGLLSFPMEGVSLALDFPNTEKTVPLFDQLDEIVESARGRIYPAKDAHMSSSFFRASYPDWSLLESFRDKSICSHFWRRVLA